MGDILYLVHRVPYPPDRGDKIRSFHILKKLATLAPVHLVAFADDAADLDHGAALDGLVKSRHVEIRNASKPVAGVRSLLTGKPLSLTLFDSGSMRSAVKGVLATENITTIFGFSGQMAQFVPDQLDGRRFVMDFVDMDSAKFDAYADRAGAVMERVYRREARLLGRYEQSVARRADLSTFVSHAEADLFRTTNGLDASQVQPLENGIDLETFNRLADFVPMSPSDKGAGPLIVFTGQMDYWPNVEAVTIFAEQVMPIIRQQAPVARFAIVGRKPTDAVKALAALPGVIVTGEVPDTRSWLAAASVVVAPLRLARGVQNKVLEAMAMACPVVASPAAFEGIDAVPGTSIMVADGVQAEAKAVLTLLNDPVLAQQLGQAARAQMEALYGWDATLACLGDMTGHG
jgi:sugar transferase (PEP-CTERM/EpsH1 system associated)